MLNGLKALFTSGIIFRPMVFSGIIAGFLLSAFLDMEEAFPLFSDLSFYLLSAAWSGLYTLFFNQIYKEHGRGPDYPAMGGRFDGNLLQLMFSGLLAFIFFETLIF